MPGRSTSWENASTISRAAIGTTSDGAGRAGWTEAGPKPALA